MQIALTKMSTTKGNHVRKYLENFAKKMAANISFSIPKSTTTEFFKRAALNYDLTGVIETLAYLVGYEDRNGVLHGSELLFPEQTGNDVKVNDEGMCCICRIKVIYIYACL